MSKKKTIIYSVLGAVVVLGLVVSQFVDWPVDEDNASGNIAKSSRFSRKTADGAVGNMQELLQNDEDYKNGIVAACVIMKTRAEQFNVLEVEGEIDECSLNGKTISKDEGRAYLNKIPQGQEITAYFRDIEQKQ